jgi:WD40 repeat protein
VIGRRAFDRRMNIKVDCMDRITYQASSLQVFLTENDQLDENTMAEGVTSQIKQVFLRPDGEG